MHLIKVLKNTLFNIFKPTVTSIVTILLCLSAMQWSTQESTLYVATPNTPQALFSNIPLRSHLPQILALCNSSQLSA